MTDAAAQNEPLLVGWASRKITPTVPVTLAGYFGIRMWQGVLDDLFARALVFRQGGAMAAIIQFDLVTVEKEFAAEVRQAVSNVEGLKPENILCTATHTHTAPQIRLSEPESNPQYNVFAVARAADAVREAAANLRAGQILHGMARDDRFAFNRRYWMKSGRVITNPPRPNPEIDRPEGPTDPEIPLLGVAVDGQVRVLLANIVNHTDTISGCDVSSDWPGFFRRRLEARLGPGSMAMALIGTAGNINHFDVSRGGAQCDYGVATTIGEGCADSVEAALGDLKPASSQRLAVARGLCQTGPRELSDSQIAEARDLCAKYADVEIGAPTSEDLAKNAPSVLKYMAEKLLAVAADRDDRRFEILAMRLGDALLVSLPGEPFVEIGLKIRQELAAGRPAMVVSHGNASPGYIPNRFNFERGGYETVPASSPNSVQTADRLIETVSSVLAKL